MLHTAPRMSNASVVAVSLTFLTATSYSLLLCRLIPLDGRRRYGWVVTTLSSDSGPMARLPIVLAIMHSLPIGAEVTLLHRRVGRPRENGE